MKKVIRTITYFSKQLTEKPIQHFEQILPILESHEFTIQTKRICVKQTSFPKLEQYYPQADWLLSRGTLSREEAWRSLDDFLQAGRSFFNLELANPIEEKDVELLFEMFRRRPEKAFHFAFTFENAQESPFFPSSTYAGREGFAVGLQMTNLADGCASIDEWMEKMRLVWQEILDIFGDNPEFLGIDSSIAPLYEKEQSFIYFMKKCYGTLAKAAISDGFVRLSQFIKEENPMPIGLCGLMLPCLEDFELAREYNEGRFPIERNLFLALHSGLGIDTYPLGINEKAENVFQVLQLLQKLAQKHQKPLSARFICDGKSRIGEVSDFQNQYLLDARIQPLIPGK